MTRDNYAAWDLDPDGYDPVSSDADKLRFLAQFAVLAPSGHNTQPWRFAFTEHHATISQDTHRTLGYSGPMAAEPHASLGACAETLHLAARGFGRDTVIDYEPDGVPTATVTLGQQVTADPSLPGAIIARTSNRGPYRGEPIPAVTLERITEGHGSQATPVVITAPTDIAFMAELTSTATRRIMTDAQFRRELSDWVRSNVTTKYDGMPGFVQEMPTPPSLLAKHIIRHIDISKTQAKADAARVAHAPTLILVTMRDNTPTAMFDAGRLFARLCIQAQREGLATSGVAAAVINEQTRRQVTDRFALDSYPIAVLRVGIATKAARHSPRWPLEAVTGA